MKNLNGCGVHSPLGGQKTARPFLALLLCFTCTFGMSGCTNTAQVAISVQSAIGSIFDVAIADVPSLQQAGAFSAADATAISGFLQAGKTLDGQLGTCITDATNAGSKKVAFLSCFNTFANGLMSPAELAQLRILSPGAQQRVQLWVTAATLALNTAISAAGGTPTPVPVTIGTSAAPSTEELREFAQRLNLSREELRAAGL